MDVFSSLKGADSEFFDCRVGRALSPSFLDTGNDRRVGGPFVTPAFPSVFTADFETAERRGDKLPETGFAPRHPPFSGTPFNTNTLQCVLTAFLTPADPFPPHLFHSPRVRFPSPSLAVRLSKACPERGKLTKRNAPMVRENRRRIALLESTSVTVSSRILRPCDGKALANAFMWSAAPRRKLGPDRHGNWSRHSDRSSGRCTWTPSPHHFDAVPGLQGSGKRRLAQVVQIARAANIEALLSCRPACNARRHRTTQSHWWATRVPVTQRNDTKTRQMVLPKRPSPEANGTATES